MSIEELTSDQDLEVMKCPKCGSEDVWFDRSIYYYPDGTTEGPFDRCKNCGEVIPFE